MFEKIQMWYKQKLWSATMVKNAVAKGVLTQAQCNEILSAANAAESEA